MNIARRLEVLESDHAEDARACDDCRRAGFTGPGWCDHKLPAPFGYFVPRCLERRHPEGERDAIP